MISYLRKRTGDPDIWSKIGKRTWNVPFVPFAFSNAIKKESGLRLPQLYREMVSDLQKTTISFVLARGARQILRLKSKPPYQMNHGM